MSDHVYPRTDWSTTSFSELSTLAECEEKWRRRYVLREPKEDSAAQIKGTLFHEGTGELRKGQGIDLALAAMGALADEILGDDRSQWAEVDAAAFLDACWLVERYARHYSLQLRQSTVLAVELEVTRTLHYPTRDGWKEVTVKGYIDSLEEFNGNLWAREGKSSGRRDILETTEVAPQITLYWWMLEEYLAEHDLPPLYGVLFDYAYTYHWKPQKPTQAQLIEEASDEAKASWANSELTLAKARQEWARAAVARHPGIERPDSESFDQRWIDRTQTQVEMGLVWAQDILERRDVLTAFVPGVDRAPAIRNLGFNCKGCAHKRACWSEMAFPMDDLELVVD